MKYLLASFSLFLFPKSRNLKQLILFFLLIFTVTTHAQQQKIKILNSEQTYKDQKKYPDALILNGKVKVKHEGIIVDCNKALFYQTKNILHAYGNVHINQGDTLHQKSAYINYNGNTKKAISWGNVELKDPNIVLKTDTLHFDRNSQIMYYNCNGTINDATNQLKSKNGTYYSERKKFTATTNVVVTNPGNKLISNHLDYYTENKEVYFYGPSTITTQESTVYAEKGFFDTQKNISQLTNNSKINYQDRIIEGDSIYYDKFRGFASSTGNIVVTDTINNSIIKGGYAEVHKFKDSLYVVDKAVAISIMEKDSMYVHGDTLLITGKTDNRLVRAYHHVKIFKTDLRGKCDSLATTQSTGLIKLFKDPVLWSGENQITGDSIHLLSNPKTNVLDSLFIKKNAMVIQKDSAGFNQIRGKNMYGKFTVNKLNDLLTKGNGEVINYARDSEKILVAIMKMSCSNILFELNNGQIQTIKFLKKPEGNTYPPSQFPKNQSKLKGFLWRESEMPHTKEDIFIHD